MRHGDGLNMIVRASTRTFDQRALPADGVLNLDVRAELADRGDAGHSLRAFGHLGRIRRSDDGEGGRPKRQAEEQHGVEASYAFGRRIRSRRLVTTPGKTAKASNRRSLRGQRTKKMARRRTSSAPVLSSLALWQACARRQSIDELQLHGTNPGSSSDEGVAGPTPEVWGRLEAWHARSRCLTCACDRGASEQRRSYVREEASWDLHARGTREANSTALSASRWVQSITAWLNPQKRGLEPLDHRFAQAQGPGSNLEERLEQRLRHAIIPYRANNNCVRPEGI